MSDEQEQGASLRDRAGHEPSQQVVSAVPVTIPSAWPEFEYEDGYPEDEDFAAFAGLPMDFYRAAHWLLEELPRAAKNMPCFCEITRAETEWTERPCSKIAFSTGGWSGAESLIRLIERRFDLSHFMESWRRGGHFVFEVPDHFLEHTSMEAASAAQGMSTDTAKTPKAVEGRSPASPVRESECAQSHAPNLHPEQTHDQ